MAVVNLQINNKIFQIACNNGEEELVLKTGEEVNKRIMNLKMQSPKASTELLLLICTLSLQEQNSALQNKITTSDSRKHPTETLEIAQKLMNISSNLQDIAQQLTEKNR